MRNKDGKLGEGYGWEKRDGLGVGKRGQVKDGIKGGKKGTS